MSLLARKADVRRTRLIWTAVGAGLAAFAFLLAHLWQVRTADNRFLYIGVALEEQDQDQAIAAVGECTRRFRVDMPADGFFIVIPLNRLDTEDFVCLTEGLESVRHTTFIGAE